MFEATLTQVVVLRKIVESLKDLVTEVNWGLGIGDWGLGIGPIPNPQSPIPNPQFHLPFLQFEKLNLNEK